ncbi:MAG: FAD-binding oxidoreductase [Rhodospirillales bacterium]|jgi:D-amino-acid dehydrogenase|nr:FAD-binding oxidoreductase [Rhodospirillales bacterium]MDP6883104.1 FAD-binding oxidoreductase [Rhodospirillales bacterium]
MAATKGENRRATVVGAGIVGVCSALYLQREGFTVTLIDRRGPGEEASTGNGGCFGYASCVPLSMPGLALKAPLMLLDPDAPFKLRWRDAPRLAPWFLRFLGHCNKPSVEDIADARFALLSRMYDGFDPLLASAGADDMVIRDGMLYVFETEKALAQNAYGLDLRRRRGIEMEELSGDEAREMEPALGPSVRRAFFFPQVGRTINPLRLTQVLARHFTDRGGTVLRREVTDFEIGAEGPRRVIAAGGGVDCDLVVIAAGTWSRPLARKLGSDFPLVAERGYNVMLPDPGVAPGRCVISGERYVGITPMEHGLRVAGLAEFAAADAPPVYARAERLLGLLTGLFPGVNTAGFEPWMGPRPSLPDSTPVIGWAPKHGNVLFAFGHDHIGLSTAGITGKLIGELAAGGPPSMDIEAYRPDRF